MARPIKVNRLVFTSAITEYITDDGKGLISLILSDREVAEELSLKLGIDINSEYVRNFRRSQNIASGISWGGKRNGAGRPSSVKPESNNEGLQDVVGIIDMNSKYATERWHDKCVTTLSRMYGGGDSYMYSNSEIKEKIRGTGKVGKGGGVNNIKKSQAYLVRVGQ